MPSYQTPKRNSEYVFYLSLISQADTRVFRTNPTLAAGDCKISTDGGTEANIATLPVVTPAGSKRIKVTLSAAEMNGDNIQLTFSDVAGAEWCDLTLNIQTTTRQVDDLAFPTVSGRGLDVATTGEAGLDFDNIKDATSAHTLTNITVPAVITLSVAISQVHDTDTIVDLVIVDPLTEASFGVADGTKFQAGDSIGVPGFAEVMHVTAVVLNTLTVTRQWGGTSAHAIANGETLLITRDASATSLTEAQVRAQANGAIEDNLLNFLLADTVVLATTINRDSVMGQVMDDGSGALGAWTYIQSQHSLEAIRKDIDSQFVNLIDLFDDNSYTQADRDRDNAEATLVTLNLDTTVSSRAPAATAISTVNWTNARAANLDNLDITVSSRLAATSYVAPDNTTISNIFARTDVATSTRLAAASYTAPDNTSIAAIKAKTDQLVFTVANRVDASATVDAADVLFTEIVSGDTVPEHCLAEMILMASESEVNIEGTQMTIRKPDGSTLRTKALTPGDASQPSVRGIT